MRCSRVYAHRTVSQHFDHTKFEAALRVLRNAMVGREFMLTHQSPGSVIRLSSHELHDVIAYLQIDNRQTSLMPWFLKRDTTIVLDRETFKTVSTIIHRMARDYVALRICRYWDAHTLKEDHGETPFATWADGASTTIKPGVRRVKKPVESRTDRSRDKIVSWLQGVYQADMDETLLSAGLSLVGDVMKATHDREAAASNESRELLPQ